MKKLLLLAALAAPLFASAQAPATEAGMPVLRYEMPKGTLYGSKGKLLPPMVELTWANASYYVGDASTPATPMTDADFTWTYTIVTDTQNPVESNGSELVTPVAFAFPGRTVAPVDAPVLKSAEAGDKSYKQSDVYFGNSGDKTFKVYENAVADKDDAYTYGSEAANNMWANYCPEISNLYVSGFAQKLEYAGAPYILKGLTINSETNVDKNATLVVSIYEAPGEDGILPATPLTSVTAESKEVSFNKDEGIRITTPVVVVISDFAAATFSPKVAVASAPAYEPAPQGQGLYALVSGTDAQGNQVNKLASINEPSVAKDGTQSLPIALDLTLNISYPYFIPYQEVSSETDVLGQESIKVFLDGTVTAAQYRCVSSAKASEITVTLPDGSELPTWVNANVTDGEGQTVILSISQPSTTGGVTPIAVNLPGLTSSVFTVVIDATGGIDAVESASPVVGREYYDLSGCRLNDAPRSGFYIEKAIRADGTSTATRHIR